MLPTRNDGHLGQNPTRHAVASPPYEQVLNNENYRNRLCFTSSLDTNFIPGAVGLIRSIRKFYSADEADIILFIDRSSPAFDRLCDKESVELHFFHEIEDWVRPLVYADPLYANDSNHFYHPDFQPKPTIEHHVDRIPGLGTLRHLHPLNVKAYCTGYCLCIKNYRRVIRIDCDAFLLARVDATFEQFNAPGTVIAFDDGSDQLANLEALFDVTKPANFTDTDYGFNAGVVFYNNNRAVKQLTRDFMFYVESCYHYTHAGYFADQGILRALVAKHAILGNIRFWGRPNSRVTSRHFGQASRSQQHEPGVHV